LNLGVGKEVPEAKTDPIPVSGYGTWVSEIMLQQTRVETVVEYYLKWMKRFPTVEELSKASLDEVNAMWAGLGYYRRAKYLHLGAQKVVGDFKGKLPETVKGLREIPGIGQYTAGAVASIAFGCVTPIVDGNVIRVLSRLRALKVRPVASKFIWSHATTLVKNCPDIKSFNQGLMELGAMVCTPRDPKCDACPLREYCHTSREVEVQIRPFDVKFQDGDACEICEKVPLTSLSCTSYPLKKIKKKPREERMLFVVFVKKTKNGREFFLMKRDAKGLLAGQWAFPELLLEKSETATKANVLKCLEKYKSGFPMKDVTEFRACGEIVHIFSHIRQTIVIAFVSSSKSLQFPERECTLIKEKEFIKFGVTTGVKKVFKAVLKNLKTPKDSKTIDAFFKRKKPSTAKPSTAKRKRGSHVVA